jgi:hypothetical protein
MRRRYAHGEWCLRENSRPPCRQQVRPRKDLLSPEAAGRRVSTRSKVSQATVLWTETIGLASKRWPDVAYRHEAADRECPLNRRFRRQSGRQLAIAEPAQFVSPRPGEAAAVAHQP